jgi:hypothetical protein
MPRARDTASQVVPLGRRAGAAAVQGLQQGMEQGVHDAREWVAPRIDDAAAAVTDTVAPKVSAALKAAARRVEPPPAKTWRQKILGWPGAFSLAAMLAVAGAVAVLLRKRQPEMLTPPGDEAGNEAASSTAAGLDAEANGRVRTP